MSSPDPRDRDWGCQRWNCGHGKEYHSLSLNQPCQAYHCRCRGWIGVTEQQYNRRTGQ